MLKWLTNLHPLRGMLFAGGGLLGMLAGQVGSEAKVALPMLGEMHTAALLAATATLLIGWSLKVPGTTAAPAPVPAPSDPPAPPP